MMHAGALIALGCCLPAADGDAPGYKVSPRFATGQELVYSGTMTETVVAPQGVRYEQAYDLEVSALVMRIDSFRNAEIGCHTVMKSTSRNPAGDRKPMDDVVSSHFDSVKVSPSGAPSWLDGAARGVPVALPVDGRAPWEMGFFMEVPEDPIQPGGQWMVQHSGQPPVNCRVAGVESRDGEPCVKLVCTQQSPTWSAKQIQNPSWRSETSVWISQKKGLVQRVDRRYEVRMPGEESPSRSIVCRYSQATNMVYSGQEIMERTADMQSACRAQMDYDRLASGSSDRTPRNQLAGIKHQLKYALDKTYATPYRPAMEQMLSVVEEAEKAVASRKTPSMPAMPSMAAAVGRAARGFLVKTVEKNESITLKSLKGRACAIVFVDPESPLSTRALSAVVAASTHPKAAVEVFAVCTKSDAETVSKLRQNVPGNYVVCRPQAMDRGYGMTSTPHTIFVDADGVLRANFGGLGPELAATIAQATERHGVPVEKIGVRDAQKPSFLR